MQIIINNFYNFLIGGDLYSGQYLRKEKHTCMHCKTTKNCLVFKVNDKLYHIGITCLSKVFKSLKNIDKKINQYKINDKDKFLRYFDEPRENEYNMFFDFDSINDNI